MSVQRAQYSAARDARLAREACRSGDHSGCTTQHYAPVDGTKCTTWDSRRGVTMPNINMTVEQLQEYHINVLREAYTGAAQAYNILASTPDVAPATMAKADAYLARLVEAGRTTTNR